MSIYSSLQKAVTRQSLTGTMEGRPKDAIKKMAVLFTDIVGSSQFFRARGDIAGREMLQRHQDLATPPIGEHGGIVVKMLGDSVMAYFLDAGEALKSAIKIQERFKSFNQGKDTRDQIHIRLGIHFGEGIVEEDDIFGDVVNMAAKFLPLVKGDQIVISQEVCDQLRAISSLRMEEVRTETRGTLPEGLTIYRVIWDESINLNPLMKTLVYFKPLLHLGRDNLRRTWDSLIRTRDDFWKDGIEEEHILADQSVVLLVREATWSLSLAKSVLEYLRINLAQEAAPFVPVQIVIDTGPYLRVGRIVLEDLRVNWKEIEPGEVYISAAAYHYLKGSETTAVNPPPPEAEPGTFYKFRPDDRERKGTHLFLYQNALNQGENSPCFYCGDRNHAALNCPSKKLTELTSGLDHLGYLPVGEINKLFFDFLNEALPKLRRGGAMPGQANNPAQWACHGFYELKAVYQLRFFTTIWNSRDESWNGIKEGKDDREKGGLTWIGLDCIRVGNLEQARAILSDALRKNPHDYKVYCSLAFLNIEKGDFSQARYDLLRALEHTETGPQKIFILFLLSRVYDLNGDRLRAENVIRKIINLNPYCCEALYQDILFKFQNGKGAVALHQLIGLIRKSREYYLYALIDPELANFSEMIHEELGALYKESRMEALDVTERAGLEVEKIEKWLDKDEKEVTEARSLYARIKEQNQGDGYFGGMDIIHFGNAVINMGRLGIERRLRTLSGRIEDLRYRAGRYGAYIDGFPYRSLVMSVRKDLGEVQTRIQSDLDPDRPGVAGKFRDALILAGEIASQLDRIEWRLHRLDLLRRVLQLLTGFLKKTLIFQSANLLVAVVLFPILAYYLNFLVPGFRITPDNIWTYQKTLLILGSISALVLAFVTTAKGTDFRP